MSYPSLPHPVQNTLKNPIIFLQSLVSHSYSNVHPFQQFHVQCPLLHAMYHVPFSLLQGEQRTAGTMWYLFSTQASELSNKENNFTQCIFKSFISLLAELSEQVYFHSNFASLFTFLVLLQQTHE